MFDYLKALLVTRLPRNERGQDLAEYALLIGLIALIVVGAVSFLGDKIDATFSAIGATVGSWGA